MRLAGRDGRVASSSRAVAPALLLVAAVACAERASVPRLPGCYDLTLGPWQPAGLIGEDSLDYEPPPRVVLDSVPIEAGADSGWLPARPAPNSLGSVHHLTLWRPEAGDTVRIFWSTGFVGLSATLTRAGAGLRGTARSFTDVYPSTDATRTMEARRVDCTSRPPRPAGSGRRLFRRIVLSTGDTVTLGRPLPPAAVARRRAERGSAQLRGTWGDAAVRVDVTPGDTVLQMAFYYPPRARHATLAAYFAQKLGPPTWRSDDDPGNGPFAGMRFTAWKTRDVEFVIAGQEQVHAWLRDPSKR